MKGKKKSRQERLPALPGTYLLGAQENLHSRSMKNGSLLLLEAGAPPDSTHPKPLQRSLLPCVSQTTQRSFQRLCFQVSVPPLKRKRVSKALAIAGWAVGVPSCLRPPATETHSLRSPLLPSARDQVSLLLTHGLLNPESKPAHWRARGVPTSSHQRQETTPTSSLQVGRHWSSAVPAGRSPRGPQ